MRSFWWGRELCWRRMFPHMRLIIVRRIGVRKGGAGDWMSGLGGCLFGVRLWAMRIGTGWLAKLPRCLAEFKRTMRAIELSKMRSFQKRMVSSCSFPAVWFCFGWVFRDIIE